VSSLLGVDVESEPASKPARKSLQLRKKGILSDQVFLKERHGPVGFS